MYEWAKQLIKAGKAYVDDQTPEQIRTNRGTLTEPGTPSPFRERSVDENLSLFERMEAGEFPDGSRVLRARIDMASPNMNLRDPVMYRILAAPHPRTGNRWKIYPMYDWAHGLEDSIEGISHSLCSLEFADHRPLYDWFLEQLGIHHPQQIEFGRVALNYTVMSKRKLLQLVEEKYCKRLGRSPAGNARRPAAPWIHAGSDPRILLPASASTEPTAPWIMPCWSIACVKTSTSEPPGPWPCCGRSKSC